MKFFRSSLVLLLGTLSISGVLAIETPDFGLWKYPINLFGGIASGFFGSDVRPKWETCLLGVPTLWDAFRDEGTKINWSKIFDWKTDVAEAEDSWSFLTSLATLAPSEFLSCKTIYDEIFDLVKFIIGHLSPA